MSTTQKPLIIVIFGATGDLFSRKLAGALFDLYLKGLLPSRTDIVGFSRKPYSHDAFRGLLSEWALAYRRGGEEEKVEEFASRAFYHHGDLTDAKSYASLGRFLEENDHARGVCSDKLFYLAVPPNLYEAVFKRLAASGLAIPCAPNLPDEKKAWTRVLVEKPFGNNEKEAARLDRLLGALFSEEQIFRIDHYLAKETIQNIISFRFSNGLFEPLWNRDYIDKVEIRMFKKEGVGKRGVFYDDVGALRDVGQNHLLQMLALIAMENPGKLKRFSKNFDPLRSPGLSAAAIRDARRKVLAKVVPGGGKLSEWVERGQYEGYLAEPGVRSDSSTETYFRIKAFIKNSRWREVPFYLESGKEMSEDLVSVSVFFKPAACLCPEGHSEEHQNALTFSISPKEEIAILFWAKRPGFEFGLEPKRLSFSFTEGVLAHRIPNAYERVLFDCIRGDQTLFASTEEVKAEWRFITPVLENWEKLPLHRYAKGSNGPLATL